MFTCWCIVKGIKYVHYKCVSALLLSRLFKFQQWHDLYQRFKAAQHYFACVSLGTIQAGFEIYELKSLVTGLHEFQYVANNVNKKQSFVNSLQANYVFMTRLWLDNRLTSET